MTKTSSTVERLRARQQADLNSNYWRDTSFGHHTISDADLDTLLAVVEAAQEIATTQSEALKVIQQNGFVFEDIGREPGNWQHLAFTLYTMLCEIDSKLTPLLDALHSQASDEAPQTEGTWHIPPEQQTGTRGQASDEGRDG